MKEGESLTLYPGEIRNLNDVMMWHFNDIPITEISEDLSFVCAHAPCTYVDGRFRDRLQLNNQTGSLTITNITNQHAGLYHLKISSSRFSIKRTFSVTVNGEYHLIIKLPNPSDGAIYQSIQHHKVQISVKAISCSAVIIMSVFITTGSGWSSGHIAGIQCMLLLFCCSWLLLV